MRIERIAARSSRRTLVKRSLALGAVVVTDRCLTANVRGQEAATPTPAVRPVDAPVIAEWSVNNPSGVFVGFDSIWVPGHHDKTTTRIDPATNKVVAVIKGTGDHAEQALAVGEVLWVSGQHDDTTWIDPVTNTISTTMPLVPGNLHFMAYGFDSLWITTIDNHLDRIDPATGEIMASIRRAPGSPDCNGFVFVTASAVWVDQCDLQELIKIDPATNRVESRTSYATLVDQATSRTVVPTGKGTDSLWIDVGIDPYYGLLRIDPTDGTGLTFLPLPQERTGDGFVTVTDDAIWLGGINQISRVNVATNLIDATYATDPGSILHIAIGFGSVWLENYDLNLVQRLDIAP